MNDTHSVKPLVERDNRSRNGLAKVLLAGEPLDSPQTGEKTHPWYMVLWLTGVDYFSTLGYQPGIALLAAGALSVSATGVLILVTLLGAVPVYAAVAGRSYAGQGSIALLENLFSGWKSKFFVLCLLGFASTDFVITMTLSAADAARHASANPYLHPFFGEKHVALTFILLALLAVVFWLGFREAIGLAVAVAAPYLVLNACVLVYAMRVIWLRPELLSHWYDGLRSHGDWTAILLASAIVFPKLALGLSGFETGVSVMPLVSNDGGAKSHSRPETSRPEARIKATRKLLLSAALVMCAMLLVSSFVAALLIPESAYRPGGEADGRAIAYLAHHYLGGAFGSLYDLSTILVLWFAGASAMTGLLNLIPRYLPRLGMAPHWVAYRRPLVLVLLGINLLVTAIFRAGVEEQGSAYATGVLVLMLSAAIAVTLAFWQEREKGLKTRSLAIYFGIITLVFGYTLVANVIERPTGVIIASCFTVFLLLVGGISRYYRATEMRVADVEFVDDQSERLWNSISNHKVNLIPHHANDPQYRDQLGSKVEQHFKIEGPLAFLYINLLDNRSDFLSSLRVRVTTEGERFVIDVWGAVATANVIAYLSELLCPKSLILGLTRRDPMRQSIGYALWGEGEVGLSVYSILVRYWESTKRKSGVPVIYLMSE